MTIPLPFPILNQCVKKNSQHTQFRIRLILHLIPSMTTATTTTTMKKVNKLKFDSYNNKTETENWIDGNRNKKVLPECMQFLAINTNQHDFPCPNVYVCVSKRLCVLMCMYRWLCFDVMHTLTSSCIQYMNCVFS